VSATRTAPRARIAILERVEDQREQPQLLQFDFDAEDLPDDGKARGKPRSIKEALIRWLDQQL
jgi:hypothetical protein